MLRTCARLRASASLDGGRAPSATGRVCSSDGLSNTYADVPGRICRTRRPMAVLVYYKDLNQTRGAVWSLCLLYFMIVTRLHTHRSGEDTLCIHTRCPCINSHSYPLCCVVHTPSHLHRCRCFSRTQDVIPRNILGRKYIETSACSDVYMEAVARSGRYFLNIVKTTRQELII